MINSSRQKKVAWSLASQRSATTHQIVETMHTPIATDLIEVKQEPHKSRGNPLAGSQEVYQVGPSANLLPTSS